MFYSDLFIDGNQEESKGDEVKRPQLWCPMDIVVVRTKQPVNSRV